LEGEWALHFEVVEEERRAQGAEMQIRDREQNEETWPRRTPGPPKYRFIDPKVKLAIVRSQMANKPAAEDVIEELGDPVSDSED
jgi:hypothetical protein